jgi:hypothetical protein
MVFGTYREQAPFEGLQYGLAASPYNAVSADLSTWEVFTRGTSSGKDEVKSFGLYP